MDERTWQKIMVAFLAIGFIAVVISFFFPQIDPNIGLWIASVCWVGPGLAKIIYDRLTRDRADQ